MALPSYTIDGYRIIRVNEVVDLANADDLATEAAALIRDCDERTVIVDFDCPLLTTDGVVFLERVHAVAERCGRTLRVAAGHRISRKVLRITGADHLLDVRPDLPTALGAA
ncbi:STAS domain-containing protein [Streptomyces shenzhenensis]|uniref:STAS domain-containing protein n=1 Tax=Streptomyces shenzhenensis TaxID=943815 RepID=UPI001F1E73A8|nr:STAS domain-containing protein [Streptomyces shenzhenensis]